MKEKLYDWQCPTCQREQRTTKRPDSRRERAIVDCPSCKGTYNMHCRNVHEVHFSVRSDDSKERGVAKQLQSIAHYLGENAPTKVITREWDDSNRQHGGKWKLVLSKGVVSLNLGEKSLRGTSQANQTTLKNLLPGIKDEYEALVAWTEDLIKAECATEINEMISRTITTGAQVETDLHSIFCESMLHRVDQLGNALGTIPINDAFHNVNIQNEFDDLTMTLFIYGQLKRAVLSFDIDKDDFTAAMVLYNNWNDVSAFCAKVYTQLAKK